MKESNNFGCKGELLILSKLIHYFLIAKALGGAWISKVWGSVPQGNSELSYVRDKVKRYLKYIF